MRKNHRLTVPKSSVEALAALFAHGAGVIESMHKCLDEHGPTLDQPGLRASSVADRMGKPELADVIEEAMRDGISPMLYSMYYFRVSPDEMIEELDSAFEKRAIESDTACWRDCREAFDSLIRSDTLAIEAKATNLLEERSNRVHRVHIYSDLRPLFDQSGDNVKARVLTNSLRIQFRAGEQFRTESFAMDPSDLQALQEQIERAMRKNRTLVRESSDDAVPTLELRLSPSEMDDLQ